MLDQPSLASYGWQAILATRTPVPARTSQAWPRRFDSAFVSLSGCKHCSDAAVS
jgi:hypothetical protein